MTQPTPATPKPAKGDDRNLVAVENAAAPSIEDRMLVFWNNYRVAIYWAIAAAILLIVGREGWGLYRSSQEESARVAFVAAGTPEQKLAYSREFAGHPLAGVALLSVADDSFAKGDFAQAAAQYKQAADACTEPVFKSRAQLGEGIASIRSGLAPKGVGILQALANDATVVESLRCEAWLHLAANALAEGDHAKARDALDRLNALAPTGVWAGRANFLLSQLPAEDAPAPAPEATPAPAPTTP
jgi:predicted negative regulator of RcsB-dependent stress response